MTLAVVCPSKGRPGRLESMVESVQKTAPGTLVLTSEMEGRGAEINKLCDDFRWARAYLLVSDDVEFIRSGWDREVLAAMDSFGDDIGVVHLSTGIAEGWVNWPCVSRKWIDAVGWFNPPRLKHYCQDTALQALGQALGRIRYIEPPVLRHDCVEDESGAGKYNADVEQFLWFMARDFGPALERLRAVMS